MATDRSDPGPKVAAHQREGTGVTRIPYPIEVRRVQVVRTDLVTPRMIRVTLGGEELADLHTHVADDHVRVVYAHEDGTRDDPVPNDRQMLDWPRPMPPTRQYTIRRYDPEARELDLDVVVHEGGVGSTWATTAAPGDPVVVAGPPGAKTFAHTYRHYVFAIDPTALPALARWLEEAVWLEASGATALVAVDHDHPEETGYPLTERAGVEVHWFSRAEGSRLAEEVIDRTPEMPPGEVFVFAAGETTDLKPLRRWSKMRGYDSLITGYWKRGVTGLEA